RAPRSTAAAHARSAAVCAQSAVSSPLRSLASRCVCVHRAAFTLTPTHHSSPRSLADALPAPPL
ncbi:MAG: hypothetical protein P4L40_12225, partial [Terracidiphilus sp.]|nr:hypothetical protein [Terracidiphilus sp.]